MKVIFTNGPIFKAITMKVIFNNLDQFEGKKKDICLNHHGPKSYVRIEN